MGAVSSFIGDFLNNIYRPNVEFSDIAEILSVSYNIMDEDQQGVDSA